jgi:LPS export ABC transporter permease LptG/LPS export ABC transporter permease LptF
MRRLDRYVLREVIGPLVLGFVVYTFILILQYLFTSAEMIIQRGLPVATVGKLLLLVLPSSVVLTVPMALLFGILIAVGRLAADSELIALRASGVSLLSLYRPILLISAALCLFNGYLTLKVMPEGNAELLHLNMELAAQTVSQQVEPRVFYEQWEGKVLYVFEIPPGQKRWRGVFLAQQRPGLEGYDIVTADWGQVAITEDGESLILELEQAMVHSVDLSAPSEYRVTKTERLAIVLEDQFSSRQEIQISSAKSARAMNISELEEVYRDPKTSDEMRTLSRIQIHKSYAIPATCLVFGLIGLPLGFSSRRGGKSAGFALSMAVIVIYWVLLSNGENAARFDEMDPRLAMWMPNLLLTVAGLFLLVRRNRDKNLMLHRVDRWIRKDVWAGILRFASWYRRRDRNLRDRRRSKKELKKAHSQVVVRLPRLSWRFPSSMDRYIVRRFSGVFGLVLLSVMVLYVIGDLGENFDDILKNHIDRSTILQYYKYLGIQIFFNVSPIVVLASTLVTFSILARASELTAFKALGVSVFRLSFPALTMTLVVILLNVYLQADVLPASNRKVAQLQNRIKGREVARTYRRADLQWLFGQGRYVYNYLRFDPSVPSLERLQVFEFDDSYRLSRRLSTQRAVFDADAGGWIFEGGWKRAFSRDGQEISLETFSGPRLSDYPETPDYFTSELRPPEQMGYRELKEYIAELEGRGQAVPELHVQLQRKFSYPAISLVMALVALPFAFRMGRQGALYGIGVAIVLAIAFMAVYAVFITLGSVGILPAFLAVWSPNILFAMFALYLFLGVRT